MNHSSGVVVICQHGRHLSRYLSDYLATKKIDASPVGLHFKNRSTVRKITQAGTVICVHEDIQTAVEEHIDISSKKTICLDVTDSSESSKKPMTGESWLEYQETVVYPELRRQIKKHLPLA